MLVHADTQSNAACTALCVEIYIRQHLIILWASDYDIMLNKVYEFPVELSNWDQMKGLISYRFTNLHYVYSETALDRTSSPNLKHWPQLSVSTPFSLAFRSLLYNTEQMQLSYATQ